MNFKKFIFSKIQYLISGFWALTRYWRRNPLIIDSNWTKAFHNNNFILCSNLNSIFRGYSFCLWISVPILNYWFNFGIVLSNQQDRIRKWEKKQEKLHVDSDNKSGEEYRGRCSHCNSLDTTSSWKVVSTQCSNYIISHILFAKKKWILTYLIMNSDHIVITQHLL